MLTRKAKSTIHTWWGGLNSGINRTSLIFWLFYGTYLPKNPRLYLDNNKMLPDSLNQHPYLPLYHHYLRAWVVHLLGHQMRASNPNPPHHLLLQNLRALCNSTHLQAPQGETADLLYRRRRHHNLAMKAIDMVRRHNHTPLKGVAVYGMRPRHHYLPNPRDNKLCETPNTVLPVLETPRVTLIDSNHMPNHRCNNHQLHTRMHHSIPNKIDNSCRLLICNNSLILPNNLNGTNTPNNPRLNLKQGLHRLPIS